MGNIIELLRQGNYSCIIINGTEIRKFNKRGVADLYGFHLHPTSFLQGAAIADKVIGVAAAALIINIGIKKVYTEIISLPAAELLRDANIEVDYIQMVPMIENRERTDWCPLEKLCLSALGVEEIIQLIEKFMLEIETKNIIRK